jgi:hypothetical protein
MAQCFESTMDIMQCLVVRETMMQGKGYGMAPWGLFCGWAIVFLGVCRLRRSRSMTLAACDIHMKCDEKFLSCELIMNDLFSI